MTQQQIQSNLKKYWWFFPLLGLAVWAALFYWAKQKVGARMEEVRQAREVKDMPAETAEAEILAT